MKLKLKKLLVKKMKIERPSQLQIYLSKIDTVKEVNDVTFFLSEKKKNKLMKKIKKNNNKLMKEIYQFKNKNVTISLIH